MMERITRKRAVALPAGLRGGRSAATPTTGTGFQPQAAHYIFPDDYESHPEL